MIYSKTLDHLRSTTSHRNRCKAERWRTSLRNGRLSSLELHPLTPLNPLLFNPYPSPNPACNSLELEVTLKCPSIQVYRLFCMHIFLPLLVFISTSPRAASFSKTFSSSPSPWAPPSSLRSFILGFPHHIFSVALCSTYRFPRWGLVPLVEQSQALQQTEFEKFVCAALNSRLLSQLSLFQPGISSNLI